EPVGQTHPPLTLPRRRTWRSAAIRFALARMVEADRRTPRHFEASFDCILRAWSLSFGARRRGLGRRGWRKGHALDWCFLALRIPFRATGGVVFAWILARFAGDACLHTVLRIGHAGTHCGPVCRQFGPGLHQLLWLGAASLLAPGFRQGTSQRFRAVSLEASSGRVPARGCICAALAGSACNFES